MFALLLLSCGADPAPTFKVENKMPRFQVTNRIPAPPAKPAKTYRTFQDARGQWWQVEIVPEVTTPARPFPQPATTPGAAGVVAPPPATAARPFVSLGAGLGAPRVAPYSGSDGCTSFG